MSITVSEFGDHEVIQRRVGGSGDPGGTSADVTISGTYAAESPTTIYYRILSYSDDSEVVGWTILDAAPGGGTFTGTASGVTQGGWYKAQVRVDLAGNTDETSNKWGVGINIGFFGQSLMSNGDYGGPVISCNDLSGNLLLGTWRAGVDYWNSSDDTFDSIIPTFIEPVVTELGIPIGVGGYAQGGLGIIASGVGVFTDRNVADPDDPTTIYGRLLTKTQAMAPEVYVLYQCAADADGGTVARATYQAGVITIIDDLTTDLGYTPTLMIIQGGMNTGSSSDYGRAEIQTAHADLHNGTTRFVIAATWDITPAVDGLHPDTAQRRTIGTRAGRGFLRWYNDKETRPGYITGVTKLNSNDFRLNITTPETIGLQSKTDYTPIEVTKNEYTLEYSSYNDNNNVTIRTKHGYYDGSSGIIRYAYGAAPDNSTVITNDDGDAIMPMHDSYNITGEGNMALNGIPLDDEVFTLYFSNWVNGPATKQSGNYPSSPNGAFQNCAITDSSNEGDGFVKGVGGNGYFKTTKANEGHIVTDYKFNISDASIMTMWTWITYERTGVNRFWIAGTNENAQNFWYFRIDDAVGRRHFEIALKINNIVVVARTDYNIIPSSGEVTYLVFFEKNGGDLKFYVWDGGLLEGENGPGFTYIGGTRVMTNPMTVARYNVDFGTAKLHVFQITDGLFTADEKTAIYNAGPSLGWYGYNTGDNMILRDSLLSTGNNKRGRFKFGSSWPSWSQRRRRGR